MRTDSNIRPYCRQGGGNRSLYLHRDDVALTIILSASAVVEASVVRITERTDIEAGGHARAREFQRWRTGHGESTELRARAR